MATILLTWELGFGMGHLMNLRPIGQELIRRGHQVVAIVRDLPRAKVILGTEGIVCLPAPLAVPRGRFPFDPPQGYAHMLGNLGYGHASVLAALLARWNALFDDLQPNLVVADHSPTALLALWGRSIPRVNVGLAFFCPPPGFPLPAWSRDRHPEFFAQLLEDERRLTETVNSVLTTYRRPCLENLGQYFNQIDDVILATYREFDLFGPRAPGRYWGHWPFGMGCEPLWPQGQGPRIFSYLKASPMLGALLEALGKSGFPTLMFASEADGQELSRHSCSSLRVVQQPLDLQQAAAQCDFAITNGGHGTVATLLLAGKPCLLLPLSMEQVLFGQAVERLGAGRLLPPPMPGHWAETIADFASSSSLRQCAQRFAQRYGGWTPGEQIPELVDRLEQILDHK